MSCYRVFRQAVILAAFSGLLVSHQALAVEYMMIEAFHVDDLEAAGKGKPGKPLKMLNWSMGGGPVLTHVEDEGVGARISSFIKFEAAGSYAMQMKSNDGVRLTIGGQVVVDDPDVHADKFSDVAVVSVPSPGWYAVYLLYYERRGTATLELRWQPPGAASLDFVPAAAFAH